jgi:hypothetical protein
MMISFPAAPRLLSRRICNVAALLIVMGPTSVVELVALNRTVRPSVGRLNTVKPSVAVSAPLNVGES